VKTYLTLLPFALLFSCASHDVHSRANIVKSHTDSVLGPSEKSNGSKDSNYLKILGDSVEIPPFEIEVSLSPKAEEKLKEGKETVIVVAYFTGKPKDTTLSEYKDNGEILVTSRKIELAELRKAKFEGIKFSKGLYDSLSSKDISLLINVFSGRRSTDNNLLSCGIIEQQMSKLKGTSYTIKGRLIEEPNGDF
jgi:hypothetical protein